MRLLILGGTVFVGLHIVRAAVDRGHSVTLLTRGLSTPEGIPNCEHLIGDRRGDMAVLDDRTWDAVIDTSGYRPEDVHLSAEHLKRRCGAYAFISTLDVYFDHARPGLDEDAPTFSDTDDPSRPGYGPRKALCERAVTEAFGNDAIIVRPGLIVGPGDPSERFGYWPVRFALGGEVLMPGGPDEPIQILDARDHAIFLVDQIEQGVGGFYNVTSPAGRDTFGDLAAACQEAAGQGEPVWVHGQRLAEYGVRPWTEMPLWPGLASDRAGTMQVSTARAEAAGLRCRPLSDTVSDVLAWEHSRGIARRGVQLPALKERMLLLVAREEGWTA